jgi:peptide/nickel transport system substrate-binding protein
VTKESIIAFLKQEWHIPFEARIMRVIHSFSLTEKVIFIFFSSLFFISGIILLWQVNSLFLVEVPNKGGSLTEGVIGSPRFVNPLLALSDTDRDLSTLIYSGLLKATADGSLVPDLAESYTVSPNGLVYTFTLKQDIYFHDGTKVTADDVVFTIQTAQDPNIKSPRKKNWDGVTIAKIDDKTVTFTLKQAYAPIIQNMTLGILPKHIWKNASADEFPFSQYNTQPIGSGPYMVDSIAYGDSGLPSEYTLQAYEKYALGEPFITNIVIKSYQNEKNILSAYENGDIESIHSISPVTITKLKSEDNTIIATPLPRVFGVFFNQSNAPLFLDKEVRQALALATNKQEIIDTVLAGFGHTIDEPIPLLKQTGDVFNEENISKAESILTKNGWARSENGIMVKNDKKEAKILSFSISTSDVPELKTAAEILQKQWQKIGAQVEVKIFESGDLNQNVIRPRKYDALLFGEIIGREKDLYPFWHSSQRTDPGLNIALYTNIKADKMLESLRTTTDSATQDKLYQSFNQEIKNDVPAVFIYSPSFLYLVPEKVHNVTIGQLTVPAERFNNIETWYIETNKVWKMFAHN